MAGQMRPWRVQRAPLEYKVRHWMDKVRHRYTAAETLFPPWMLPTMIVCGRLHTPLRTPYSVVLYGGDTGHGILCSTGAQVREDGTQQPDSLVPLYSALCKLPTYLTYSVPRCVFRVPYSVLRTSVLCSWITRMMESLLALIRTPDPHPHPHPLLGMEVPLHILPTASMTACSVLSPSLCSVRLRRTVVLLCGGHSAQTVGSQHPAASAASAARTLNPDSRERLSPINGKPLFVPS
jgi:hypothetical protein